MVPKMTDQVVGQTTKGTSRPVVSNIAQSMISFDDQLNSVVSCPVRAPTMDIISEGPQSHPVECIETKDDVQGGYS